MKIAMILLFILGLTHLATAQVPAPQLSEIVKNQDGSVRLMFQSSDYMKKIGRPLPQGEMGAKEYCASINMHLPSAREWALYAQSNGSVGASEKYVPRYNIFKHQSYGVNTQESENSYDAFFYSSEGYITPRTEEAQKFWAASTFFMGNLAWTFNSANGDLDLLNRNYSYFRRAVRCVSGRI